jgi:hypothetical protein
VLLSQVLLNAPPLIALVDSFQAAAVHHDDLGGAQRGQGGAVGLGAGVADGAEVREGQHPADTLLKAPLAPVAAYPDQLLLSTSAFRAAGTLGRAGPAGPIRRPPGMNPAAGWRAATWPGAPARPVRRS